MIKDKLKKGSFRGIEFDFIETSKSGGRKSVIHTFPNSDTTISEDLGAQPKAFPMRIIVGGDGSRGFPLPPEPPTRDYFSIRDSLEEAIEKKGPGWLVHPTRGSLFVQVTGSYTINENITELGIANIDVTFTVVDNKQFLPSAKGTESSINDDGEEVKNEVAKKTDPFFTAKFKSALKYIQDKTDALVKDIKDRAAPVISTINDLNTVARLAQNIQSDVNNFIEAGFGSAINTLLSTVGIAISDPFGKFEYFAGLFNFGDDDIRIEATTIELADIVDNQDATRTSVQTTALMESVSASTEIEYQTDEELNDIAGRVQAQYDKVLALPLIDSDIFALLQEQRVSFTQFVEDQTLQVLKVTTVTVVNESLLTLTYRYYGNLDNVELIQNLNSFENPSLLNGEIKIATG